MPGWTDFFKDPKNWLDIAGMIGGGLSANQKSKNALNMGDLKDLYLYQNPAEVNPFFSSSLVPDGQGGLVRNTQFSPAIQGLLNTLLGTLGQEREISNLVDPGMFGAQSDYQRSRWGLGPGDYDMTPPGGGGPGVAPEDSDLDMEQPDYGGTPKGGEGDQYFGIDPGGLPGNGGLWGAPGMLPVGGSPWSGGSNFDMLDNLGLGWMNQGPGSGIPYSNDYGGYGSDGQFTGNPNQQSPWEQLLRFLAPLGADAISPIPGAGWLTDEVLDNQIIGGDQSGFMDPGSPAFIPPGGYGSPGGSPGFGSGIPYSPGFGGFGGGGGVGAGIPYSNQWGGFGGNNSNTSGGANWDDFITSLIDMH